MNEFHQWKTQCPECGQTGSLFVVGVMLVGNDNPHVLHSKLEADGFEVDTGKKDCSTENETVKCIDCNAQFSLADLEIDAYYKVDPKKLSSHTKPFEFKGNMSERAFFGLALQSQAILRAINNAKTHDAELLEGLMALVDGFRDYAVESGQYTEDVVFPVTTDEKEAVLKETEVEDIDV